MIAEVADAVVQRIHCLVDRMDLALLKAFRRHIVAERAALNNIAVIHQHAVLYLLTRGMDQRRGAHQPELFGRGIFVVVEIHHVAVQIGGFQQTEINGSGVQAQ